MPGLSVGVYNGRPWRRDWPGLKAATDGKYKQAYS